MVTVISPVGLDKHAVDLLEVDGAGLVADGLDEGAHAGVYGSQISKNACKGIFP